MSKFSFSHSVFKGLVLQKRKKQGLFGKGLNISSQTAGPVWTKLGRNVHWEVLFKIWLQNLIPSKTLVAMTTKWNFLSESLNIFSSGTDDRILK